MRMRSVVSLYALMLSLRTTLVRSEGGINLGGGIVTRKNVQFYADLSLDIRDLKEGKQNTKNALRLYKTGANAELESGVTFSLQELNQELSGGSLMTPQYLYHVYGLSGSMESNSSDFQANRSYADKFVRSIISSKLALAPEALQALTLWMYGTHLLLQGVDVCFRRSVADDPDAIQGFVGGGMDEFIALWVGNNQISGEINGHSLYSWTEKAAQSFKSTQQQISEEALPNLNLKLLYQQGAGILTLQNACTSKNPESVKQLWTVVQQMISQMFVPQLQMLIHALLSEDTNLVRIYATAVVPQIAQCRPSVFKRLKNQLLGERIDFARTPELLKDLESMYSCLGLSCKDVGTYRLGGSSCSSTTVGGGNYLAGYYSRSPVESLARIDLDILQIKILTSLNQFRFARYLYQFGRNVPFHRSSENDLYNLRSLHELAVTTERQKADPIYSYFVAYFNDIRYADTSVDNALRGIGKWESREERSEVIITTCAFQIVFLYTLARLKESVVQCRENPQEDWELATTPNPWDEVAALLIGSMEGPNEGGSMNHIDGQLFWSLANRRAFQFNTLNNQGYANANDELDDLLYAGRGELDAQDCDNLEQTANKIRHVMVVPIVQSTIRYAIMGQGVSWSRSKSSDRHTELALGEIFAFSILPIFAAVDSESAVIIRENMELKDNIQPIRSGPQLVADALGSAAVQWGLECHKLGRSSNADPCQLQKISEGATASASSSASSWGNSSLIVPFLTAFVSGTVFTIVILLL